MVGTGAGFTCRPDGAREAEKVEERARRKFRAEDEAIRGRAGDGVSGARRVLGDHGDCRTGD